MEGIEIFKHEVCYWPKGLLTFSSSSMLQIMWAQVVKISTARERVRIPYTCEKLQRSHEIDVSVSAYLWLEEKLWLLSVDMGLDSLEKGNIIYSYPGQISLIQRIKASRMLELSGISLICRLLWAIWLKILEWVLLEISTQSMYFFQKTDSWLVAERAGRLKHYPLGTQSLLILHMGQEICEETMQVLFHSLIKGWPSQFKWKI